MNNSGFSDTKRITGERKEINWLSYREDFIFKDKISEKIPKKSDARRHGYNGQLSFLPDLERTQVEGGFQAVSCAKEAPSPGSPNLPGRVKAYLPSKPACFLQFPVT